MKIYRRSMCGRCDLNSWLKLLLILALSLSWRAPSAAAHGGGTPRLLNAELGAYWVSVWTQPDPLRSGQVHVTLALSEPPLPTAEFQEAGAPVLNVPLELRFQPLDQPGEVITAIPSHDQAVNKLFYETDLVLPQIGRWEVIVQAENPDGSTATVSFPVEVLPAPIIDVRWLLAGGIALFLLVGWGITRSLNSASSEQAGE